METKKTIEEKDLVKIIKSKIKAIEEDLLLSKELTDIKNEIERYLDQNLNNDSLLALRYRKFKMSSKGRVLYSDMNGFSSNGKAWIEPYINFFEKHFVEKKIINRLKDEKLWVESRTQGNEQHLFIGNTDDNGEKTHLIFGETGEIRIDKKDKPPAEIIRKVEAILTKPNGEIVKSTLEFFKENTD